MNRIPKPTPADLDPDRIQLPPNARTADPGLTASIAAHGVLHPVGVRVIGPGQYAAVYGCRRIAACRQLHLSVPANVYSDLPDADSVTLTIIENIHRRDASPFELGAAFLQLAASGMSKAEISRAIARPVSFVAARITLAQLPTPILDLLATVPFTVSAVSLLARLPPAKMQQLLEEAPHLANDVQAAQDAIRRNGPDLSAAPFAAADCGDCERREEDICLDESCYASKTAEHVSAAISAIRKTHPTAPCVVEGEGTFPSPTDREIFKAHRAEPLRDWRVAAPGERGKREAILLGTGGRVEHVALVPAPRKLDGRAINRKLPAAVQAERAVSSALLRELRNRIASGPRDISDDDFPTLCLDLARAVSGLPDLDLSGAFHALLGNAAHRLRVGLESVPPDASPEERHAVNRALAAVLFPDPDAALADLASK